MRLPFVGEIGDSNPYDAVCTLAQDVDLSEGWLQGRFADEVVMSGTYRRVFVKGDGSLVTSATSGYGFVWGNDVYLLNAQNEWRRGGDSGVLLSAPDAPVIGSIQFREVEHQVSSPSHWDPVPAVFDTGGWSKWTFSASGISWFTIDLTVSPTVDGLNHKTMLLGVATDPAVMEVQVYVNNVRVPSLRKEPYWQDNDTIAYRIEVDLETLRPEQRVGITWIRFVYGAYRSHTTYIYRRFKFYGSLSGKSVYFATLERNGVESAPSEPVELYPPSVGTRYSSEVTVSCEPNDRVRLYRAIGEHYFEVASDIATSDTVTLRDYGDVGSRYIPSGRLPYGVATVWGRRVVVAEGNALYFSGVSMPTRFSDGVLNDYEDPYRVILPEPVLALSVAEDALIAFGRQKAYVWRPARAMFAEDDLRSVEMQQWQLPVPLSWRSVDGLWIASKDGLYHGSRLVFRKRWQSSSPWVVSRGSVLAVVDGGTIWMWHDHGWVRYTIGGAPYWVAWDGQHVLCALEDSLIRVASSSSRRPWVWRSGRITARNKFVLDWLRVFTRDDCQVKVKTDLGDYAARSFIAPDRWKPTDSSIGGRALRWAQIEVAGSGLQSCDAIEVEIAPVEVK